MEIRVLRYFLIIYQEKSISRAAKVLHISQPTLSRQIQNLEGELGTTLFVRGHSEINLTDDGKYLILQARRILDTVDKTIQNITDDARVNGEIYIGAGESPVNLKIAQACKKVHDKYPNINFHFYSGNAEEQKYLLSIGLIDFSIVMGTTDKSNFDYMTFNKQDHWGLLVRKDSKFANRKYIGPEEIQKMPLIISHQKKVNETLSGWLGKKIENYDVVATYNLIYNASLLVKSGLGNVIGFEGIINTKDTDLKFIPLKPELTSTVNLVWNKDSSKSKAAKIFLDAISKLNA